MKSIQTLQNQSWKVTKQTNITPLLLPISNSNKLKRMQGIQSDLQNCIIILFKMSSFKQKYEVYKETEKYSPYTEKKLINKNWSLMKPRHQVNQTKTLKQLLCPKTQKKPQKIRGQYGMVPHQTEYINNMEKLFFKKPQKFWSSKSVK